MARTRATVRGGNNDSETGSASRLGSRYVTATADTWDTFAELTTWADGRVTLQLRNADRQTLATVQLSREMTAEEDGRRTLTVQPTAGRVILEELPA